MNVIYLRTFFVSYVLFISLCVIVIAPLWWQNRKRFPEIALWLTDYIFQFIGLLLITLREIIPDFFSIVVANILIIGGTIILYIGLCRYVNRGTRQIHNFVMLTVFTVFQTYLTYIYPSTAWRTINISVALFYICAQASWLMLRRADASLRSATRPAGIVFAVFCLISVIQVIANIIIPEKHTLIVSSFFGITAVVMYQIVFVALTFALFLMVSRRLSMELEVEMTRREQEERIIRIRLSLLEFATTHSLNEVLQKTLDEVGDLVESPIGFYHFVEEDQKTLFLQAWSTRTLTEFCNAEGKGMHYAIDQAGVWTDCVHQKRAVIHNDYSSLPHRKGMPEGHAPVIRELVVPIMRGGKVTAILGIGNKPVVYTEKDAEIVSYLADVAWEIVKHKQAEEAVSKYSNDLKERLKEINCLYSISEIVQRKDIAQEEMFKACPAIISQAYQFSEITACRILIGDHEYGTDNFRQTPWSQKRTINVNSEPVGFVEVCYLEEWQQENDGPFLAEERNLLNAVADILERYLEGKEAQDSLRRSEEKYKQLAEVFPESIFEANMKGDVTYANPHGLEQFGLTDEDIAKGINIFDHVSPHDRALVQERIQSRIQGDNIGYLEYNALKKDGSAFHALALSVPIMVEGIAVGIRGFIMDITERTKTEEAVKQSEARLQAITNSANDAITMMDNHGNISYWNPAAERIFGYTAGEAIGKDLHKLLTPERFMPAYLAALPEFQKTGRGNAIGKTLELVARRKDGREIDVALSLSAVNVEGTWHAVGIVQDITERKRSEEKLRDSEERYRFIANNTADHIWTMDLSMHFTYSSPAVVKTLGYTIEEIIALPIDQVFMPESLVMAKNVLAEELEREKDPEADPNRIRTFQSEHYNKNGQLVWLESSLTFIRDVDMRTIGILGVSRNITERKQAEEHIKHLATHDLLTDLPSLRLAMDRLASALNLARRYKKAAAVMFIDLDGFKNVNDTLGHDAGDYVLKQVAQRLLSCVRETDTVARVGGDEFLIIATEINSPDNAAQIAEKVIQTVSQPIMINGEQAMVSTSIGIALFPEHGEDMDKLIKLADEAMYKVKNSGKNNFRFVND